MANATRKQTHSYRVSYAQEVGSSYDPDMEDASRWEEELTMGTASPGMFPPLLHYILIHTLIPQLR
jgi:hypothetical protein